MLRALFHRLTRVFWLLPGFLLWASFPPMGETADCLFALAPLMWLARCGDVRRSVRLWFLNGCLFWVATLSWMPAIVKNGGPWPLVVLGWGALSAYCALYFAAFGWLAGHLWRWARRPCGDSAWRGYAKRLAVILLGEPILWAGLEIVRSRFLGGFAWNQLGVAPVNAGFASPCALGGVYLVSAFVILINGTLASVAERMLEPLMAARRRRQAMLAQKPADFEALDATYDDAAPSVPRWVRGLETLLPLLIVWGGYQAVGNMSEDPKEHLKVAMVQRNFPSRFSGRSENPLRAYEALSKHVAPLEPDLVVLPESAFAEIGRVDGSRASAFAAWLCERCGAKAMLAGGGREGEDGRLYNSAVLFTAENDARQIYDKVHLVPFGEFIPGDKWFPVLQKLAPVGSCTPGELKLLSLPVHRPPLNVKYSLGTAICFEDTDSAQMRQLAAMGAQALVFITNDSWFSRSVEAEQHAWQAVARAVETGLPVVRVGNSGVTGTVMPDGKATWLADASGHPIVDRRGTLFDRVAVPARGVTAYVVLGDTPLFVAFLLLVAAVLGIRFCPAPRRSFPENQTA